MVAVDLNENEDAVLIYKKGKVIKLDKPASGYGEHTITWSDGEIKADRVSYTNKR